MLDPVVVSAGQEKVASDTPQAVSVVNQEDLEREQPTTVGDALTDLPGIKAIGSDRVLGEGFNIRGFGSDLAGGENRLILQVDGATKFYQQYRMGSLFTEPELYKRVEVLRGPASSTLYGSG
ncbi:MAG: Plug domain-containing protein, partial [Pseudomonadota bacterium]